MICNKCGQNINMFMAHFHRECDNIVTVDYMEVVYQDYPELLKKWKEEDSKIVYKSVN